jgi:RNA polymerase sigma-70 factor (sigma-E family)
VDFEEYVQARGQALVRLAYVLTGDPHSAEDLAQTALADAYRSWWRVRRADHPDAYVRRVLINAHLSRLRRRSSGELPSALAESATETFTDPADDVADRDAMWQVLAGLSPRARAVLVLRYYVDLDDAAIADTLGVSVSTVRATASRALDTLRRQLVRVEGPAQ